MKKIIFTNIISLTLVCFIASIFSTHSAAGAEIDEKYVAAKSGLNLRSDPGKSSKVITTIPSGSKVAIEKSDDDEIFLDGRYGKWVNVKFANNTGWVFSGFLCDFEPATIIKPAADYYRTYYSAEYEKHKHVEWYSELIKLTKFKDNEVSIETILDNYIVLKFPGPIQLGSPSIGTVVWKYDLEQKNFFEVYNFGSYNRTHLLYLDKDRYLDLVVEGYGGHHREIHIFLGTENGFVKIFETGHDREADYATLTIGSCGDMELEFNLYRTAETMYFYRFNCENKKFEKYAESAIIYLEGIITSIDWKNMSIVIKDKKSSKDASYKFSDKQFSKIHVETLKKELQKGGGVSFNYVTTEGKRTILYICPDGEFCL